MVSASEESPLLNSNSSNFICHVDVLPVCLCGCYQPRRALGSDLGHFPGAD